MKWLNYSENRVKRFFGFGYISIKHRRAASVINTHHVIKKECYYIGQAHGREEGKKRNLKSLIGREIPWLVGTETDNLNRFNPTLEKDVFLAIIIINRIEAGPRCSYYYYLYTKEIYYIIG